MKSGLCSRQRALRLLQLSTALLQHIPHATFELHVAGVNTLANVCSEPHAMNAIELVALFPVLTCEL